MRARTPEECIALFASNLNSGNLDGLVGLYEPGASFVLQDGPPARGTAIRDRLAAFLALHLNFAVEVTKVIKADESLTVLYSDWSLSARGPDSSPIAVSGKAIEIVRRQADGSWLLAVDDLFARS